MPSTSSDASIASTPCVHPRRISGVWMFKLLSKLATALGGGVPTLALPRPDKSCNNGFDDSERKPGGCHESESPRDQESLPSAGCCRGSSS